MGNCHRHWVKAKSCDVVQAHKSCTTHAHSGPPLLLSRVRMRPFLSERALPGVRRPVTISRNATRNCFHSALPFASLPPLFASFSLAIFTFYILYIYIRSKKSVARSWQSKRISNDRSYGKTGFRRTTRKLRGPVSIAPRDSSPVPARPNTFLSIIHRRIAARERPTTLRSFGRIWSEPSTDRRSKR